MSVETMIGDETATVESSSATTKDAAGGFAQNWHAVYSDVPIRDEITGSSVEEKFGQKKIVIHHMVYTQQSGITIGMRFLFNGAYLNVVGTMKFRERSPSIPTWYQYICEEHQGMS